MGRAKRKWDKDKERERKAAWRASRAPVPRRPSKKAPVVSKACSAPDPQRQAFYRHHMAEHTRDGRFQRGELANANKRWHKHRRSQATCSSKLECIVVDEVVDATPQKKHRLCAPEVTPCKVVAPPIESVVSAQPEVDQGIKPKKKCPQWHTVAYRGRRAKKKGRAGTASKASPAEDVVGDESGNSKTDPAIDVVSHQPDIIPENEADNGKLAGTTSTIGDASLDQAESDEEEDEGGGGFCLTDLM